MCIDLRCDLAETESPREDDYNQRSESYRRIDADDYAQCQAPRQTARCDAAAAQLTEERPQNSATEDLAYGLGHEHIEL